MKLLEYISFLYVFIFLFPCFPGELLIFLISSWFAQVSNYRNFLADVNPVGDEEKDWDVSETEDIRLSDGSN